MSWVYVPASAGWSSDCTSPSLEQIQSYLSSKTSFASPFSRHAGPQLRSGATSSPSTPSPGADSSMYSQPDSPASPGQPPASRKARRTTVGSGRESLTIFAMLDRATCSWKTSQASLFPELDTFSRTWPRWGMMRSGACSPASNWEPAINATESSSWPTALSNNAKGKSGGDYQDLCASAKGWPTPVACSSGGNKSLGPNAQFRPSLENINRLWQTPIANDSTGSQNYTDGTLKLTGQVKQQWPTATASKGGGRYGNGALKLDGAAALWSTPCAQENDRKNSTGPWMQLSRQVKPWPTPTAIDAEKTYDDRGSLGTVSHGHLAQRDPGSVSPGNYGQLNPRFVQWLMGFPEGWTHLEESVCELWETQCRHQLLLWLGEFSKPA